eukprot:COSAG01_NODE_4044_length_5408_cov_1.746468_8_plen_407_part_00
MELHGKRHNNAPHSFRRPNEASKNLFPKNKNWLSSKTAKMAKIPAVEYPEDIELEENDVLEQDDSDESPPSDIVAFNELRSCADLVRMYKSDQLTIKPDFQRDIVWPNANQTRFIDSLTKQLPIPSMCISLDYNTNKRLVIDGLQRMWSIIRFLTEPNWKLSNLKDIDDRLSGKRVSYIKENNTKIYDQVENLTIPVTVLRCDYNKQKHMEYLFTIFHRLNTGANRLTNQEIRNCIYSGELNEILKDLTAIVEFRDLFGLEEDKSYRFAYEEFALRVIAFSDSYSEYDGNLSQFLNRYMERARKTFSNEQLEKRRDLFTRTTSVIFEKITDGSALPKLSKATYESLFVGVAKNIKSTEQANKAALKSQFKKLRSSPEFAPENLRNAITTKEKLKARMRRAVKVFKS